MTFSALSSALATLPIDAVFVNTPPGTHRELCVAAIDAGCHVICEKPLGRDSIEAAELLAAATAAGKRTAVNFTYRSMPGYRLAERWLRAHELGTPLHAELALLQGHNFSPDFLHGSALRDSGSHLFDLLSGLLHVAGFGAVEAVCAARMDAPDAPGELGDRGHDHGWSFVGRTGSGATATATFSRSSLGWRNGFRWSLYGESAALDVELDADRTRARCVHRGDGGPLGMWRELAVPEDIAADDARFPAYHMDRLVRAARGEEVFPGFQHAVRAHLLAEALAASHERGGWVDVPADAAQP